MVKVKIGAFLCSPFFLFFPPPPPIFRESVIDATKLRLLRVHKSLRSRRPGPRPAADKFLELNLRHGYIFTRVCSVSERLCRRDCVVGVVVLSSLGPHREGTEERVVVVVCAAGASATTL